MTDYSKYYIWLTQALGYNNHKIKTVYDMYDNVGDFFNGGVDEWRLLGIFNNKEIESMESVNISAADGIILKCNQLGISVISIDDPLYPDRLRDIYAPPAVLYVSGKLPDFNNLLTIGMIGTRNATSYGVMASHIISGSLAKLGVIIVSGGAIGIDKASHIGAMEGGGITVCVLGCGINYPYLMQNAQMRKNILYSGGALISEYPPDYPAAKYTFPARNRIISGLSNGVVIVEAGEKSGSLITASTATEQGRDVFAVMGNITSRYSEGTNRLIKDGALPVMSYKDIIENYPQYNIDCKENSSCVMNEPVHKENIGVSDNAKAVYYEITSKPVHIDALVSKTKLPVNIVLQSITELELSGLVEALRGRMYKLV